jgi:hypothetical protein
MTSPGTASPKPPERIRTELRPAIFAGAASGLLLGVLVGLAVSPVVGSLVGGLVTLLGLFLGFKDDAPTDDATVSSLSALSADARRLAVGSFALACVVGVILGLALRARDVLALSPEAQIKRWKDAGYADDDARAIVVLKSTGIVPRGYRIQGRPMVDGTAQPVILSSEAVHCHRVNPSDHADARNLGSAFTRAGGRWSDLAIAADSVRDERARFSVLRAAWALLCG